MSKILTKDELIESRVELENDVNTKQQDLAEAQYSVDFENVSNITAVLKTIDKSYNWSIKNAAFVINLYDTLKANKVAITKTGDDSSVVSIGGLDLNTLYTVLTNIEGTGIESARTFTRLLTNVGKQISEAMETMAAGNREIQEIHGALSELDVQIAAFSKETVEADEIS